MRALCSRVEDAVEVESAGAHAHTRSTRSIFARTSVQAILDGIRFCISSKLSTTGWKEQLATIPIEDNSSSSNRCSRQTDEMKSEVRVRRRQCKANDTVSIMHAQAQRHRQRDPKMRIINVLSRRTISEIKLKRTDTTLDLSQKATERYR